MVDVHQAKGETMKTIAELASELNVTPQAIYKKIKQFKQPLKQHLHKGEKGKTLIDSEGQVIIRNSFKQFKQSVVKQFQQPFNEQFNSDNSQIIKLLEDNINILQEQLKTKDKQIEDLTATVKTQAESINIERKNELAGTLIDGQKKIDSSENISNDVSELLEPQKGQNSFFKRLFGKYK